MSNGTLQQLASKGVQDGHLSISPETSFFKRTYKRVSNYAIEAIDQTIPSLAWGNDFVTQLSRNGDLVSEMWLNMYVNLLQLSVPAGDTVHWTNVLGHAMLKNPTIEIGNNQIDNLTDVFMEIQHELESSVDINVNELVLRSSNAAQLIDWSNNGNTLDLDANAVTQLIVKLPFWFSKARSQSLPVIALQYHDIRVKFGLRKKDELMIFSNAANKTLDATNTGDVKSGYIMSNFVYLDSMERRLFASNAHEYLIKNVQTSDFHVKAASGTRVSAQVVFNHPVCSLFWFVQKKSTKDAFDYFNFERTDGLGDDTITGACIKFNGAEREKMRGPLFYRTVQPALYYNRTPRKNVYIYSFAQTPSMWFPSGSVNLSRIDVTSLEFSFPTTDSNGVAYGVANVTVIAQNFNVIRIQGGSHCACCCLFILQLLHTCLGRISKDSAKCTLFGETPKACRSMCFPETEMSRTLVTPVPVY